jgi:hypothetical protein
MDPIQREIEDERRSPPKGVSQFTAAGSLGCWGVPATGIPYFAQPVRQFDFDDWLHGGNTRWFAPPMPARAKRTTDHSRQRTLREREIEWRRNHPEQLREFENQWVALEGEQLIAHGTDPAEVIKKARALGIKRPYVFFVEQKKDNFITFGL